MRTYPVDYAFEYETRHIANKNGERAMLRVDCTVELVFSKNYAGLECYAIESVEVHDITDLDASRDVTYLKTNKAIRNEILEQVEKADQYLSEKVS